MLEYFSAFTINKSIVKVCRLLCIYDYAKTKWRQHVEKMWEWRKNLTIEFTSYQFAAQMIKAIALVVVLAVIAYRVMV